MRLFNRATATIAAAGVAALPLMFNVSSASAVTSAPTARTCEFGPHYDYWSQHETGVTVTFYSFPTWGLFPRMNVVAKAARYKFDWRSQMVALNAQIKLGGSWKSVPIDNTWRPVGSVPLGTSFGSSGGWFKKGGTPNIYWFGRSC